MLAQCRSDAMPSCQVYTSCFARYCPCDGDANEYFVSYGKKYCERFLAISNFSDAGKKWRDSTLRCLQGVIVPKLDISESPKCNCVEMKAFAFRSHVECYTKNTSSICELPLSDVNRIRAVIDIADAFSAEGWRQMRDVANICAANAPDDSRRSLWKLMNGILAVR